MLCLYQHFSMVDRSGEDHFACDNYDWLWITSILKEYVWWYISLNTRELLKILCAIPVGSMETRRSYPQWDVSTIGLSEFHLISWCGNFVETHKFRRGSGDFLKNLRKLCVSKKFPHQEIRWNYSVSCSGMSTDVSGDLAANVMRGPFIEGFR